MTVLFDDYLAAARAHKGNDQLSDGQIYGAWDSSFGEKQRSQHGDFRRGYEALKLNGAIAANYAAGDRDAVANNILEGMRYDQENPVSDDTQKLQSELEQSTGFWEGAYTYANNLGGLVDMGQEVIPLMGAIIPAMAVGGAVGSLASPLGSAIGAWQGSAAVQGVAEYSSHVRQDVSNYLIENNLEANVGNIHKAFDTGILENNVMPAIGKAEIVSLFDIASLKAASVLTKAKSVRNLEAGLNQAAVKRGITPAEAIKIPAIKAELAPLIEAAKQPVSLASRAKGGAQAVALGGLSEGMGEYVGSGVAYDEWDAQQAITEGLIGLGAESVQVASSGLVFGAGEAKQLIKDKIKVDTVNRAADEHVKEKVDEAKAAGADPLTQATVVTQASTETDGARSQANRTKEQNREAIRKRAERRKAEREANIKAQGQNIDTQIGELTGQAKIDSNRERLKATMDNRAAAEASVMDFNAGNINLDKGMPLENAQANEQAINENVNQIPEQLPPKVQSPNNNGDTLAGEAPLASQTALTKISDMQPVEIQAEIDSIKTEAQALMDADIKANPNFNAKNNPVNRYIPTNKLLRMNALEGALNNNTIDTRTADQMIADKKAATEIKPNKGRDVQPTDSLLTAVSKLRGITYDDGVANGFDSDDLKRKVGIKPVFNKNGGMPFDSMSEALNELGYDLKVDGVYSKNKLIEMLQEAVRGTNDHYTEAGNQAVMAAEQEGRMAEEADRRANDPDYANNIKQEGYDTEAEDIQQAIDDETINGLIDEGILTEDMMLKLTNEEIHQSITEEAKEQGYEQEISINEVQSNEQTESIKSDSKSESENEGKEGDLLTSHTEEDIAESESKAKQDEQDQKKADVKAKVDKEAEAGLELTGSDRKADANPNQDDVFSETSRASVKESSRVEKTGIINQTEAQYVRQEVKNQKLNKKSTGYKAAVERLKADYLTERELAEANLPFKEYKALPDNEGLSESMLKQSYDALREDLGVTKKPLKSKSKQTKGGLTKSQATTELRKDKRLAKALDSGLLNVVETEADIPDGAELYSVSGSAGVDAKLLSDLNKIHDGLAAYVSTGRIGSEGTIFIDSIKLPKDLRGEGIGSEFIKTVTDYADNNGVKVALTADGDFGGSKAGQVRLYKRHGFIDNKGRNKDYSIRENMIREPKQTKYSKADQVIQGATLNGKAYVVVENNTKESLSAVSYHELAHALMTDNEFMDSEQRAKLLKRLSNMRKLGRKQPFWQSIEQRIKDADTPPENVLDEIAGYALQSHLEGNSDVPSNIVKWAKEFIAALKAAIFKHTGIQFGKVTPEELLAMTKAYVDVATKVKREVKGEVSPMYSKESESVRAHKAAQKNASLPISEGGLGLPANNTAMDRARAMGFDVGTTYYHGTDEEFNYFDLKEFGKNYGTYGEPAIYFTSSESHADDFGGVNNSIIDAYLDTSGFKKIDGEKELLERV